MHLLLRVLADGTLGRGDAQIAPFQSECGARNCDEMMYMCMFTLVEILVEG